MVAAGRPAAMGLKNRLRSFLNGWNMVHLKDGMLHSPAEVQTSELFKTGVNTSLATCVPEP
jgi:hypothetical protein